MSYRPVRFRKKPVEIEAMHWDGSAASAGQIIQWILDNDGRAGYECADRLAPCSGDEADHHLAIDTLEGRNLDASPGWWVIRGVEGEFYPCKPSVFAATYRAVE